MNFSRGIVVYPYVITNTGNCYDTKTGKFTSPRKGTYVFFVTTVSYERFSVYLDIVHNGEPEVRTMSTSVSYQTGTNMVVLELQKGDTFWVRMNAGERYYTYSVPLTTFSGFFLWIRIMYLDWFDLINVFTGIHVFYDLSTIKRLNSIFCSHVFLCAILVQRRHAWSKNKCWTTFSSHILLPFTPFSWIFMVSFRFPHFGNIHTLGL